MADSLDFKLREARDILPTGYSIDWENTGASNLIPVEQYNLAKQIAALESAIYAVRRVAKTSGKFETLFAMRKALVEEYELFYEDIDIDAELYY